MKCRFSGVWKSSENSRCACERCLIYDEYYSKYVDQASSWLKETKICLRNQVLEMPEEPSWKRLSNNRVYRTPLSLNDWQESLFPYRSYNWNSDVRWFMVGWYWGSGLLIITLLISSTFPWQRQLWWIHSMVQLFHACLQKVTSPDWGSSPL